LSGIITAAHAAFDACNDFFPHGQVPKGRESGRELCFDEFAVFYSAYYKRPIYSIEKLDKARLSQEHLKRTNQFYEEARLPSKERAHLDDYKNSGYDRGHNAPSGDMTNERAMAQSFSLANMMPQAPENNRGIWAKNVEGPTRKYALRADGPSPLPYTLL
jgi:endonuclease G